MDRLNLTLSSIPARDYIRYEVSLTYMRENEHVVYRMKVRDLSLGIDIVLVHRFSQLRKFHDQLVRAMRQHRDRVPEFPHTNSFAFWNRTNADPKKLE